MIVDIDYQRRWLRFGAHYDAPKYVKAKDLILGHCVALSEHQIPSNFQKVGLPKRKRFDVLRGMGYHDMTIF